MNAEQILSKYLKNTKDFNKQIDCFFADVVLGLGGWKQGILPSGRKVIVSTYSGNEFTALNRQSAVQSIKTLSHEYPDIDLSKEINSIENAKNVLELRVAMPVALISAIYKTEPEFIEF